MIQTLKHFFIPHAGNNYHPHLLQTKRAVFYSLFFIIMKLIVIILGVSIPLSAFLTPDVMAAEQNKMIRLINILRQEQQLPRLKEIEPLVLSTRLRTEDMATYQYTDHAGPAQHNLEYFLGQARYEYETAGENLAVGSLIAEDIFREWKRSPTHYTNLIDPDFIDAGLGMQTGVYRGQAVAYTALHLGRTPKTAFAETETIKPETEPIFVTAPNNPLKKYTNAKKIFGDTELIFPTISILYITFLGIFIIALLLNICIEFRRQHPHIILQTCLLITLLTTFILV